ncbi:hypothetical protein AB0F17_53755 [Nonomuraea sp. NPDC026600]|uniref:hypothetical protein n=1 Tax=Nonomuraea sp. NPDC026600 TaxID=3155363 RepID=UPI0033D1654F
MSSANAAIAAGSVSDRAVRARAAVGEPELHLTPSVAVADPFSRAVVSTSATSTDDSSKVEIRAERAYL